MGYTYDFDEVLDRTRERSKTWDFRTLKPGQLPMNGAETHFTCPFPVLDAVREVSHCQVYGYPYFTDDFENAISGWMARRHGWHVDPKWVNFAGGIVPGIAFALQAMTDVGDSVVINTPAYDPFRGVVEHNDRALLESPLLISGNAVQFNWADLEAKFSQPKTRAFLLCDPHNPTGKCCTRQELERIADLSARYGVFVITDEVHADFTFDGRGHIPYPMVSGFAQSFSAVTVNPSKTFNVAGFRTGAVIVPNDEIRAKVEKKIMAVKGISRTITGVSAFEACYDGRCDDYADQARTYIQENRDMMYSYIQNNIPKIKMLNPDACFVCWLDCRGLGLDQDALMAFFRDQCGVLMGDGREYDKNLGLGFVRMAYGFPRAQLAGALERIKAAADAL